MIKNIGSLQKKFANFCCRGRCLPAYVGLVFAILLSSQSPGVSPRGVLLLSTPCDLLWTFPVSLSWPGPLCGVDAGLRRPLILSVLSLACWGLWLAML